MLSFSVVPFQYDYAGQLVVTRDAWVSIAKGRGGVITQVPGGIATGAPCARYGYESPFVYELAPIAVLAADGFGRLIDTLGESFWGGFTAGEGVTNAVDEAAAEAWDGVKKGAASVFGGPLLWFVAGALLLLLLSRGGKFARL